MPDELWAMVAPLLPAPPRPPCGGRHRTISDRASSEWAIGPCRTYLDTHADLKVCSPRSTSLSLLDELLGDLGLPLQPRQPQGPIHRHHRLAALQPAARITAITWRLAR